MPRLPRDSEKVIYELGLSDVLCMGVIRVISK